MNENGGKSSAILLTVIGIATLLVVVTGATFAYFAAIVNGNDKATSVYVKAATNGRRITFEGGDPLKLSGIYPREEAWGTKKVKITSDGVTGGDANAKSKYTFKIVIGENGFTDNNDDKYIQYTFTNTKNTGVIEGTMTEVATKTKVAAGEIAHGEVLNSSDADIEYLLTVYYVDNPNTNQNTGNDRTFTFYITYTWANV